jgi:hypothetical protein
MERKSPEQAAAELRDFEVVEIEEHELPHIGAGTISTVPICDVNSGCFPN